MVLSAAQEAAWQRAVTALPYPIADACRRYLAEQAADPWHEWGTLSHSVLTPCLRYLSHVLLSDLVASGRQPAHLYHRIQAVLGRPLSGQYVGFLRETALYYRAEGLRCAVPGLVDFLLAAEVDGRFTSDGKPLLGLLVEYRNLFAHGRIDNPEVLAATASRVRDLTTRLLGELAFTVRAPLRLADGTPLMGADVTLGAEALPLVVVSAGDLPVRPLLLKLKGPDLVLLESLDIQALRLTYSGTSTHVRFRAKELRHGDAAGLLEELASLLESVRSDEAPEEPRWSVLVRRAALVTDATLELYKGSGKYVPAWYEPHPSWSGDDGVLERFLRSDSTLLAVSGPQGSGKSALAARLVEKTRAMGHAVLFVNGQRFTFAETTYTEDPYPPYFSELLHLTRALDHGAFASALAGAPPGQLAVLFIDAVNEVDALGDKWNRFRAMEKLLAWIAAVAQPGLKVVLTFRLDAYEKYDYLRPDELPRGLESIAFPGTHPGKPWVLDLQPFEREQAQALYEKLQGLPEAGMTPRMTWAETALGSSLSKFTSNPLLFQVFLRAHHGAERVLTSDADALFVRYAEKLTGASELRQRPWWRRVGGFLRNGNITPKERLLVDLVDRVTEEGGAAFLVERLEPGKSRRDRRLQQAIVDERTPAYAELRAGGLIAEEVIEARAGQRVVRSRRVTFVAEVMAEALEGAVRKVETRERVWTTFLAMAVLLAAGSAISGLVLWRLRGGRVALHIRAHLYVTAVASLFLPLSVLTCLPGIPGFLGTLRWPIRTFGVVEWATMKKAAREHGKYAVGNAAVISSAWVLTALGSVAFFWRSSRFSVTSAVVACIACILTMLRPSFLHPFVPRTPAGRRAGASLLDYVGSPATRRRVIGTATSLAIAGATLATVLSLAWLAGLGRYDRVCTADYRHTQVWADLVQQNRRHDDISMSRVLIVFCAAAGVFAAASLLLERQWLIAVARRVVSSPPPPHPAPHRLGVIGSILVVVAGIVGGWAARSPVLAELLAGSHVADTPGSGSRAAERVWEASEPDRASGRVKADGLSTVTIVDPTLLQGDEPERWLYRATAMWRLELPATCGATFDLRRLPELRQLAGPSFLDSRPSRSLRTLEVTAACPQGLDMSATAPNAGHVVMSEDVARGLGGRFRPFRKNTILEITPSPGREALALDWLEPAFARCYFKPLGTIDATTRSLERLERVAIRPELLPEPAVLRRATRLRAWTVLLKGGSTGIPPAQWWSECDEAARAIPSLRWFQVVYEDRDVDDCRWCGDGREAALGLLSTLATDPGQLR